MTTTGPTTDAKSRPRAPEPAKRRRRLAASRRVAARAATVAGVLAAGVTVLVSLL